MATSGFNPPPAIDVNHGSLYYLDTSMPLHHLATKRIRDGRDLKIIITADDSETGVGKTTSAGWLAVNWTWMFAGQRWSADEHATLQPPEYFEQMVEVEPGTVLVVDDAEELDARRAMQNLNVEFSHRWMLMRLKQVITVLTLPSPAAIDSRLEELADVWINVLRRGEALVHAIGVESYGDRDVYTEKKHILEWPNIANFPELQRLREKKEEKIDKWDKRLGGDESEADTGLDKTQETFLAVAIKEREDVSWANLPDEDDRLTYSGEFYRQNSKELLS